MRYVISLILLVLFTGRINAQELFVFTEPASNMAAKSIGIRLSNEGNIRPDFRIRTVPEVMIGLNKNLMLHAQGFFSNADQRYRFEGASLYGKYRFLSVDGLKTHSRASAFLRISKSRRSALTEDINLEGDNSGALAGVVFTQLLHKLALAGTLNYSKAFETARHQGPDNTGPDQLIGYSLSSGYLMLPVKYKNYNQPNFNVYLEALGNTNPATGRSYVDLAPALQVILNSVTRIDLGYRFQLAGDMPGRYNKNMVLAKVEFNFFNVL